MPILSLSRRWNESVVITLPDGRRITVRVVQLNSRQARLMFEADADIRINRAEVQAEVDAESQGSTPSHEAGDITT